MDKIIYCEFEDHQERITNSFRYYKNEGIKYFGSECYFRLNDGKRDRLNRVWLDEYIEQLKPNNCGLYDNWLKNNETNVFYCVTDPLCYIESHYVYYNKKVIDRYGNSKLWKE